MKLRFPLFLAELIIVAIIFFAFRAHGHYKIDFFYETTHGLSIGNIQALITYYMVLFILIVLPCLIFGKRSFCHHLCWMAVNLMSLRLYLQKPAEHETLI
jgi:hypothetical protein